jgi:hypothetical protein
VAGVSVVEMAVTDESSRITRYLNAPANWSYVGSFWSIADMVVTLLPETIYPFVYSWAHKKERGEVKMKAE